MFIYIRHYNKVIEASRYGNDRMTRLPVLGRSGRYYMLHWGIQEDLGRKQLHFVTRDEAKAKSLPFARVAFLSYRLQEPLRRRYYRFENEGKLFILGAVRDNAVAVVVEKESIFEMEPVLVDGVVPLNAEMSNTRIALKSGLSMRFANAEPGYGRVKAVGESDRSYLFLGGIDANRAAARGARLAPLDVEYYSLGEGVCREWVKLPDGQHVQGAIVDDIAYVVVIDGTPKIDQPAINSNGNTDSNGEQAADNEANGFLRDQTQYT